MQTYHITIRVELGTETSEMREEIVVRLNLDLRTEVRSHDIVHLCRVDKQVHLLKRHNRVREEH